MTLREQFEAWARKFGGKGYSDAWRLGAWDACQHFYTAGREAMRAEAQAAADRALDAWGYDSGPDSCRFSVFTAILSLPRAADSGGAETGRGDA